MPKAKGNPTVLLVTPIKLPVPAVRGGAIEQLVTDLLDINELEEKVKFIVVSKYDKEAAKVQYKKSETIYFDGEELICSDISFRKIKWMLYLIYRKIFKNHISIRIFPKDKYPLDYLTFQCYLLAKRKKVDVVVNEGIWQNERFDEFNDLVGANRVFFHVHHNRLEEMEGRKIVRNSISISNYVREGWVHDKTLPGKNIVLYNGIDVNRFENVLTEEERRASRQNMGVQENEILVIFCGRLIPEKGVSELLDAFALLKETPVKLLLIGSAAFSDSKVSEYSEQIKQKADSLSSVIQMGYIPNNRMPEYYALADIQVIPSTCQEGAGLVALEGMASGLPLIVTCSGGMVEYVSEETAIELPIDNELPKNIANAITMLIKDKSKRAKMAEAGRKRALQFTREHYYNGFVDICKSCMDD